MRFRRKAAIAAAMETHLARRVISADRQGSSWPVLIETDAGVCFTKLRGAAQGAGALASEIIVARLAEAIGLNVPARCLVRLEPSVESADRSDELRDLLDRSAGINLGFAYLRGAKVLRADELEGIHPDTASAIFWLDGLVMNPDRTARNPNLLWWQEGLWLVDHGAALGFQHNWPAINEEAPRRPGPQWGEHVLLPRATLTREWDPILAERLSREVISAAAEEVPLEFMSEPFRPADEATARRRRAAYAAFLWKRLKPPRPFI